MRPSCVVNVIREKYPSENSQYTCFKDGKEASEIDFSWVGGMQPGTNSEHTETFIAKLVNGSKLLTAFTRYSF